MSTETDTGEAPRPQINVTPDAETLARIDRFRAPSGAKRATAALALLRRALDTIEAERGPEPTALARLALARLRRRIRSRLRRRAP